VSARLPWTLVVPVKRLSRAKSRLAVPAGVRAEIALAFAVDTVAAAVRADGVGEVLVVTDDARASHELGQLGAVVVRDEPDAGLNPALLHGAARARELVGTGGVAALSADLPALRSDELARVLHRAREHALSYVLDAAGTGTTLLCATDVDAFGPASGLARRRRTLDGGQSRCRPTTPRRCASMSTRLRTCGPR
jgi:2-phospho-L-lactate guanylyltransferase